MRRWSYVHVLAGRAAARRPCSNCRRQLSSSRILSNYLNFLLGYFTPNYKLTNPPLWRERNITGFQLVDDLFGVVGGLLLENPADNMEDLGASSEPILVGTYSQFFWQDEIDKVKEYEFAVLPIRDYAALLFQAACVAEYGAAGGLEAIKSFWHEDQHEEGGPSAVEDRRFLEDMVVEDLHVEGAVGATSSMGDVVGGEKMEDVHARKRVKTNDGQMVPATSGSEVLSDAVMECAAAPNDPRCQLLASTFENLVVPSLDCEFSAMSLADAPAHGVPQTWVAKLMAASDAVTQALVIERNMKYERVYGESQGDGDMFIKENDL